MNGQTQILPSASRTTTQTSNDLEASAQVRAHLVVDVTSAGTGSITPKIQGKDINGIYYDILVGSAITATGTTVLKVGPGYTPSANAIASDSIPKKYRVVITANNANAMTYSVGLNTML